MVFRSTKWRTRTVRDHVAPKWFRGGAGRKAATHSEERQKGQSGLPPILRTVGNGSFLWLRFSWDSKGNRTAIRRAGVESGAVMKRFHVVEDGVASLGKGREALVIDDFVFQVA